MFASGIEGNEYYIKPFSFREFALQSIDFISKNKSELASSLVKLKPILYSSHLDLHHDFNQNKKAIEQLLPFTTDLLCLFRLYLTTGGLSGVINHYFSNRFLDQKDRIEDIIAEIFIRDVRGDLGKLKRQEVISRQILEAIIRRYGSRYSFSNLSGEIMP